MLILLLAILALASPALFGGKLTRLAQVRLTAVWIPVTALVAQVVIIEVVPDAPRLILEGVHLATYLAAGVFVLLNRKIPGLGIIAVGALMNGVTIALNGGTLPASAAALRLAGVVETPGEFINSAVLSDPVFPLLGDIFVWPAPLPLANVFSFGDVVIVFGAFYGAQKICGSRLVKPVLEPAVVEAMSVANGTDPDPAELGAKSAQLSFETSSEGSAQRGLLTSGPRTVRSTSGQGPPATR